LTAEVTGEVETEEGVLVIRRIHVAMRRGKRSNARTAFMQCAARSTGPCTRRSNSLRLSIW
jgi:hypothetical protein